MKESWWLPGKLWGIYLIYRWCTLDIIVSLALWKLWWFKTVCSWWVFFNRCFFKSLLFNNVTCWYQSRALVHRGFCIAAVYSCFLGCSSTSCRNLLLSAIKTSARVLVLCIPQVLVCALNFTSAGAWVDSSSAGKIAERISFQEQIKPFVCALRVRFNL